MFTAVAYYHPGYDIVFSDTLNEATAAQIAAAIRDTYIIEFEALHIRLAELKQKEEA